MKGGVVEEREEVGLRGNLMGGRKEKEEGEEG